MIEQYLNPAQQEVNLVNARDNVVVGGRGIGKSVLHAMFDLRNMQRMPGSNGGFVSANTKRCLTNTIPSMLQHWERWGFHRGKHYLIGVKPPKKLGWPDPVIPPSNWENTISFYKEYSSVYNVEVLGMDFIKQMKRDLPALTFQTSIMCKRPSISLDGFYSNLRDVNLYTAPNLDYLDGLEYDTERLQHVDSRMDADVDPDRPLCIAFDANALINWIRGQQLRPDE